MAEYRPAVGDQGAFLDDLVANGYLVRTGVDGVYGHGGVMEGILSACDALVSASAAGERAEQLSFPPVLARRPFEASGYLKSFPHLAGTVYAFEGSEADARAQQERAAAHDDWSEHQCMSDLVLPPAACYPVYPAVADRGPLPRGGVTVDTGPAYVFRREPSGDPARLQMFRMRELVRIGEPETVSEWRDHWRDRALELLRSVGLEAEFDVASDPFFGRVGRMLAASQKEQSLKFEILGQIAGPEPTAVASFNYHEDHFAQAYGLTMAGGGPAHTACLGFGLERMTLALLSAHGLDLDEWPVKAREKLWPA